VASLLVIRAAEILGWQDPVSAASGLLQFLAADRRKIIATHEKRFQIH
jgi:hypothetical protein